MNASEYFVLILFDLKYSKREKVIVNTTLYLYQSGTLLFGIMLVISSREFRQNQKKYFEIADEGEQVIVQRGKNKAYVLTPVQNEDIYLNSSLIKRIKDSIAQVKSGKTQTIATAEEIDRLLGL